MGVRARLARTRPSVGLALIRLVGLLMRDVALTRDEVDGLMAGLLTSGAAPTGTTRLADGLDDNADGLGRRYVSELRPQLPGVVAGIALPRPQQEMLGLHSPLRASAAPPPFDDG